MRAPIPAELSYIPSGPEGTRETLRRMAALVREYRKNADLRELALELTRPLRSRDYVGEVREIHAFVSRTIRYTRDVTETETLQTPLRTIQSRAGDCDDHSILTATLLQSIGHHPVRFVAMGFAPSGDAYSHVLTETRIGGARWLPLETTLAKPFGWSPPHQTARMIETI